MDLKKGSPPTAWHMLQVFEILDQLETTQEQGLTQTEVARRQNIVGLNELREQNSKKSLRILAEPFAHPLVFILLAGCLLSLFLSRFLDAGAILLILLLNSFFSFSREYRVEKGLDGLQQIAASTAKVRRDSRVQEAPARDLVPGDILLLEDGDLVPADARLLGTLNLRVRETALTSVSHPVEKTPQPILKPHVALLDRYNMVYMGTTIAHGKGEAVIVATGMDTEMGRIAGLFQSLEVEKTPLQRQVKSLVQKLSLAALAPVLLVCLVAWLQGSHPGQIAQAAILVSVAAMPVGLPVMITAILALGARRMLRGRALVRKLPIVEALGSVTVICSDKTGTLTENHLSLAILDIAGHPVEMTETLRMGKPVYEARTEPLSTPWPGHLLLLAGGALCNNAGIDREDDGSDDYHAIGDPTEGAWLVAAARFGLWKPRLERLFPRQLEVPFSSGRRRMSTIHRSRMVTLHLSDVERPVTALFNREQPYIIFCKGSLDSLLEVSNRIWLDGEIQALTPQRRAQILATQSELVKSGLRVQAVAFRPLASRETFEDVAYSAFEKLPAGLRHLPRTHLDVPKAEEMSAEMERDLILVGMVAMMDPPRPEVLPAVMACREAGIRPVMITADHPVAAVEIARALHFTNGVPPRVLTGQEMTAMSRAQLESLVDEVSIFTSVTPEHKLDIVHALQKRGNIVAITGEGVKDAPTLRKSNIGVAMGINGTEVSRKAASMVILDDNFATIVRAVEEGRRVYAHVLQSIGHSLSCNAGETLALLLAPLLGIPFLLTLPQIVWINLVAICLPGLALASDQSRAPAGRSLENPQKGIVNRRSIVNILGIGAFLAVVTLAFAGWAWSGHNTAWQSLAFSSFVFLQAGLALAAFSEKRPTITREPSGWLLAPPTVAILAVLATILLQTCAVYWRPLQGLLGTTSPTVPDFLLTLGAGAAFFLGITAWKTLLNPLLKR